MGRYRDAYMKLRGGMKTPEDLVEEDIEEKFGLKVDQEVIIGQEGPFFGQITTVAGFTRCFVIVPIKGPPGEPDSEWWFSQEEIQPVKRAGG